MRKYIFSAIFCVSAFISVGAQATTVVAAQLTADGVVKFGAFEQHKHQSVAALIPGQKSALADLFMNSGSAIISNVVVTGRWDDTDSGYIGVNWGYGVYTDGSGIDTELTLAADLWRYSFVASGNGEFLLDYRLFLPIGQSGTEGLNPLYGSGGLPSVIGGDSANPTGSGLAVIPLVSGQTYDFVISNNSHIILPAGTHKAGLYADIYWSINYDEIPVTPEPGVWAMFIAGFGAVGIAARRRRTMLN